MAKKTKRKTRPRLPQGSELDIRGIPLEKINAAAYNPRLDLVPGDPEYENIKKSIDTFGYVDPMVWNERSDNLVGGHQRFKILKKRGHKAFDCSVVNLGKKTERKLNVALNKEKGDWDFNKLSLLLRELQARKLDVSASGFNPAEIGAIGTFDPQTIGDLPRLETKKPGSQKKAFLLIFRFPSEKELDQAKEAIGLEKLKTNMVSTAQFKKITVKFK